MNLMFNSCLLPAVKKCVKKGMKMGFLLPFEY